MPHPVVQPLDVLVDADVPQGDLQCFVSGSLPQRVERVLPAANVLNHFFFRVEQTIPKSSHHVNYLAGNFKIFQNEEVTFYLLLMNIDQGFSTGGITFATKCSILLLYDSFNLIFWEDIRGWESLF